VQYDTNGEVKTLVATDPLRRASYGELKTRRLRNWVNTLKRLITPTVIMIALLGASSASAAEEPALLSLPTLTYPTSPEQPEIAKFLNRCVDFDAAARIVVRRNNDIWAAHERLVATEEYNRGLDDADAMGLRWYHWAGIVGGTLAAGAAIGFVVTVAVVK
jgi:hypothetical protein